MYQPFYTKQFRKDIKRIEKSGDTAIEELKIVIKALVNGEQLDSSYRGPSAKRQFQRPQRVSYPNRLVVDL